MWDKIILFGFQEHRCTYTLCTKKCILIKVFKFARLHAQKKAHTTERRNTPAFMHHERFEYHKVVEYKCYSFYIFKNE